MRVQGELWPLGAGREVENLGNKSDLAPAFVLQWHVNTAEKRAGESNRTCSSYNPELIDHSARLMAAQF